METALLTACGLLLIGFVLRAKLKILQVLYIPAAVLGGMIGLMVMTLLTPLQFSLDLDLQHDLDHRIIPQALEDEFDRHSISLTEKAHCTIQEKGRQWEIINGTQTFFVAKEAKQIDKLTIYHVRTGWNTQKVSTEFRSWPSWLVAVIFATLLLERPAKSFRASLKLAAREGIVVWIIILGEITVGLLVTWLCLEHFGLTAPGSFGQLIEVGFAGGHGTAAAMGAIFQDTLAFPDGIDLGYFFATTGLVLGIVSGIGYINIAVRRGWTRAGNVKIPLLCGLEARHDPQPIASGRVRSEVIDPLVFQVLIVAVSFAAGIAIKFAVMKLIPQIAAWFGAQDTTRAQIAKYADNMPLFMFTLVAGLLVREAMHLLKIGDLIDPASVRRITAASMEFLIVAAISSMKLSVLAQFGWPILLLVVLAFVWTGFCLLFLARKLLPKAYWFELGILNYGMSTGTTAQGMMLLRIIDKDLESGAAEDYALAAPLSAPFIGGGVITLVALPWLLQNVHIGLVALGLFTIIAALFGLATAMAKKSKARI